MEWTMLLLAGGKSSRMGVNKALLTIGGVVNISRVASELKKVSEKILVITNTFEDYRFLQLPLISDLHKDQGPLGGLHAGMSSSKTDLQFLTACDMPFVSAEAIKEIISFYETDFDAVIPEINGRIQPLFAVYHKRCLPVLTECLVKHELKMGRFLEKISVKIVKETDFMLYHENPEHFQHLFFNMNTREDYQEAGYINQTELYKGW
ncbi:putative molybdenum cofactor guanylyltransferase [Peribacillus sp. Bi96]|uniref:molybdenum cofactor guanylyltransferase n=1 Tax=unclassified Peribacillus TaxID=2675266 RepID=UPI001D5F52BE|nr:molybdenum cofactor guanylyltransferase [Peribacillus sp. Bi96]CAH0242820.1 putative molybdenum cofactor guanylyltransferase [Peribacillus sp. Bi96]